jgi:membrane protein implicated in regulation of membrane protease activity
LLDALFLFSAGVGGATVVLRMLLMLFGVGDDHSFGSAHDIGADDASDSHSDLDAGTRLITLQGVAAFMMMFGLVGLALTREAALAPIVAVPIALGAGFLSMWILARVFAAMIQLQSSGTLDLRHAIGREGVVYLTIKPGTGGQVQVDVQGRLGVYDAQGNGAVELATGRAVRVVGVRGGTLVVEALSNP